MPEQQASGNKLGLWTTTSLVIGNMVGAGFFLLPAALASFGAISLFGWVLSSIGALLLARIFSNVSKLLPGVDGGPYAYTRKGFGDFAGFIVAWGYWISCMAANAAIAVSLVSALSTFFPILATNTAVAVITGLSSIWIMTWINSLGIRASGNMQLVTTVLRLIPLLLVAIVGFFYIRWEHFLPFNVSGMPAFTAIVSSATLTMFAFLGIECATIPASNVARPEKTIPRATMLGTIITTAIYILSSMTVMGIISAKELQHSVTPFADAASVIWGGHARYFIAAGVAMASLGALNGWILIQGQIPHAIAKDKLFPEVFAKENKNGAPARGIIISSVVVSILMSMNFSKGLVEQFRFMILLSTLTTLVPYAFVAASYVIIVMDKKSVSTKSWIQTILLASLAFLFSILAIIGSGEEIVFWGFVLLLMGTPFYVWIVWKKRSVLKK